MRNLKLLLVILLTSVLLSCTSMELNEAQKNQIKKIGVVALVNDFYTVDYVGITVFNNKHIELKYDADEYIKTIGDTATEYLKSKGYDVIKLDVNNDLRAEYTNYMSRKLETKLSESAKLKEVDTIIVLHDGSCTVVGPPNNFGQSQTVQTSGHGFARRVGFRVQQHLCLSLDVVKVKGFEILSQNRVSRYDSFQDIYIINRIVKEKAKFEFTKNEEKVVREYYNKHFKYGTELVLDESNL